MRYSTSQSKRRKVRIRLVGPHIHRSVFQPINIDCVDTSVNGWAKSSEIIGTLSYGPPRCSLAAPQRTTAKSIRQGNLFRNATGATVKLTLSSSADTRKSRRIRADGNILRRESKSLCFVFLERHIKCAPLLHLEKFLPS